MKNFPIKRNVILVGLIILISVLNMKYSFIVIPSEIMMKDYQFNIFTISAVFAGFSFTILGLLVSLSSEELLKKIKETGIMSDKSSQIVNSITYFCAACIMSLVLIIGLDQVIGRLVKNTLLITTCLYLFSLGLLFIGILSFVKSSYGVYYLIQKVYGYNVSKFEVKKKIIQDELSRGNEYKAMMGDDIQEDE